MIYTSLFPYYRSKNEFTLADHMGSFVAHTELPLMALRHGLVDGLCFVKENNQANDIWSNSLSAQRAVRELQVEFGKDRIQVRLVSEVPSILMDPRHIFVEKASQCMGQLQSRNAAGAPVAICGLLHALHWQDMLQTWMALQFLTASQDALVVPCASARRAVNELISQTEGIITARAGVGSFRSGIRVETIPYGVDPSMFDERLPQSAALQLLGMEAGRINLLWFGRLDEGYKADLLPLLRSFAMVQQKGLNLHLIIAGSCPDPSYPARLLQAAGPLGILPYLSMHANVTPAEKRALFCVADIFVSPVDNIQESYGISILEAMAAGLPVIASDWSGYRDLVLDGETGMLVPTFWNPEAGLGASLTAPLLRTPGAEAALGQKTVVDVPTLSQAIQALALNQDLRKRMGGAGKARIRAHFSWEAVLPRFADLWKQQQEQAQSMQFLHSKAGFLDLDRIFSPYATSRLGPSTEVQRNAVGDTMLGSFTSNTDTRFNDPLQLQILQHTLSPIAIRELSTKVGTDAMGTVSWLLKMGYISITASPAPEHSTFSLSGVLCGVSAQPMRICYIASTYQSHFRVSQDYRSVIATRHSLVPEPDSADLVILHIEPHDYGAVYRQYPCLSSKYVIAYCVWEADELPDSYKRSLKLVQEVWTTSEYCHKVFAKHHPNVQTVPHVVEREMGCTCEERTQVQSLIAYDPNLFYFLAITKLRDRRKNAQMLVEVFEKVRRDLPKARLILKTETQAGKQLPFLATNPPIIWVNDHLTDGQVNALYELAHAYVSPHHGEGWGLTITDAMLHSKPVIATAYSGNMEYMNDANAFLLKSVERPIDLEDCFLAFNSGMKWAYLDPLDLECKLRDMYKYHSSSMVLEKVNKASSDIRAFSRDAVGQILLARLAAIACEKERMATAGFP